MNISDVARSAANECEFIEGDFTESRAEKIAPVIQKAIDDETQMLRNRIAQLESAVDALLGFDKINDCASESGSWQSDELERAFKEARSVREGVCKWKNKY